MSSDLDPYLLLFYLCSGALVGESSAKKSFFGRAPKIHCDLADAKLAMHNRSLFNYAHNVDMSALYSENTFKYCARKPDMLYPISGATS
jgi:hypothetical protein